jgi:prepilin-type N-terminal cleavage/methylation domain-containing protein
MKKFQANKGFTLIEILVVIGIIAILAAIVLIAINPARQFRQANNSQRTANVNAILNAIGQYMADNQGTPPPGIGGEIDTPLCDALLTKYLPALPTDPSSPSKGGAIEKADCDDIDAGDVKYETENNSGRITVSAPSAVDVDTGNTDDDLISVTR